MNTIPELKPIDIAVVQRPQFDNARLLTFRNWVMDNVQALARYFRQQTAALPPEDRATSSGDEFDVWLRVQHDIEVQNVERARKVAQAIADLGNPNKPRTMYQPPKLSEHDAELQHRQEIARRVK